MNNGAHDLVSHIPRLRRYARALTGERVRADDLVQDTLERAMRKLHLWHANGDLRAWLFTIMHNVFINQLRSQRRLSIEELTDEAALPDADGEPGERLAIRDLESALQRLPDEQREVLLLVGLEQLTYAETAAVLGLPAGTVMSRLSRARERLRGLLAGNAGEPALRVVKS